MKKAIVCLALVGLLGLSVPAAAEICTIDDVPAATLLLPYFEVDLDSEDGINTLFSINNASAEATIAHVIVWTDLSVPVLDFNVYLTGYDVETFSVRNILNGILHTPSTRRSSVPGDVPATVIKLDGEFSDPAPVGTSFVECREQLPYTQLPVNFVNHLKNTLTGLPSTLASFGGNCAGTRFADDPDTEEVDESRIARGYITVDDARLCSLDFPNDLGYFVQNGAGFITNHNQLWGDYFYVNPNENFAQGETLVHIEADGLNPETAADGQYTFYGRYVGWDARDNREPLVGTFATRYAIGGGFDGGTDLLVWRDAKLASNETGYACGANGLPRAGVPNAPPWWPLGQEDIVIFDEEENPVVQEGCQVSPCEELEEGLPFPIEAQRVAVGGPALPVPFNFGWLYLNLNFDTAVVEPEEDPDAMQNWVTTVMSAEGRYSVGFDAIALDSTCNANHTNPGEINPG